MLFALAFLFLCHHRRFLGPHARERPGGISKCNQPTSGSRHFHICVWWPVAPYPGSPKLVAPPECILACPSWTVHRSTMTLPKRVSALCHLRPRPCFLPQHLLGYWRASAGAIPDYSVQFTDWIWGRGAAWFVRPVQSLFGMCDGQGTRGGMKRCRVGDG